jgi:hypothetical protein
LLKTSCRIVSAVDSVYPDNRTKFEGEIEMIAFYLSLAAFGAALITGAAAIAEARKRASLQPVRIRSTDRRGR